MKTYKCLNCGIETQHGNSKLNKYCSNKCQADYQFKTIILPKFYQGLISDRKVLRKCLAETVGYACIKCGVSEWMSEKLVLIVDHKDGNAGNNMPNNVQLHCPNCDSQSPHFSGRNRGNGRKSRNLPRN